VQETLPENNEPMIAKEELFLVSTTQNAELINPVSQIPVLPPIQPEPEKIALTETQRVLLWTKISNKILFQY